MFSDHILVSSDHSIFCTSHAQTFAKCCQFSAQMCLNLFPILFFSLPLPLWVTPLTYNCCDLLTSFLPFHLSYPFHLICYSPDSSRKRGYDLISLLPVALLIAELFVIITAIIANALHALLGSRHCLSVLQALTVLTSTLCYKVPCTML